MKNVAKTFFLDKDEAQAIHPWIDPTLPHFELNNGTKLYGYVQWVDIYSSPTYCDLDELVKLKAAQDKVRNV